MTSESSELEEFTLDIAQDVLEPLQQIDVTLPHPCLYKERNGNDNFCPLAFSANSNG